MVGTKDLFDTNILIDHLSGIDLAGEELRRYQDPPSASSPGWK